MYIYASLIYVSLMYVCICRPLHLMIEFVNSSSNEGSLARNVNLYKDKNYQKKRESSNTPHRLMFNYLKSEKVTKDRKSVEGPRIIT